MAEQQKMVEMIVTNYYCDICTTGVMRRDGPIIPDTNPVQYPHKCDVCGHTRNFPYPAYPRVTYQDGV